MDNPIAQFLVVITASTAIFIIFKKDKILSVSTKLKKTIKDYTAEKAVMTVIPHSPPATSINLIPKVKNVEPLEKSPNQYDNNLDLPDYKYPIIELLDDVESGINITAEELDQKKQTMIDIMTSFGIMIDKLQVILGPTFTFYKLVPSVGIRISRIKSLEDDIALALGIKGVNVIGHIPGTNEIGIEVPNERQNIVSMRSVLTTEKFHNTALDLPIVLGKSMANEVVILDLAKLSHLLIGGDNGQGKSVALNALIVSLLYKKHPSQLKFVLIDISRGDFTIYNKIEHHFLAKLPHESEAVITESSKVLKTLNALSIEIDIRYNLFRSLKVRNLKEYNEKFIFLQLDPSCGHKLLPFIVVVIDEFANLVSPKDKKIESVIARIAQQGRAVGIHLVISAQTASVNIMTGTIKANFIARVAFKVASVNDSKAILELGGAEKLIGNGDMLLLNGIEVMHLQAPFVSTTEVERITQFIGFQPGHCWTF